MDISGGYESIDESDERIYGTEIGATNAIPAISEGPQLRPAFETRADNIVHSTLSGYAIEHTSVSGAA